MQFVLCDLRIPHRKAELSQENEVAEVKFESISGILNSPMGVIRCARIIACRNVLKEVGDRGFPSSLFLSPFFDSCRLFKVKLVLIERLMRSNNATKTLERDRVQILQRIREKRESETQLLLITLKIICITLLQWPRNLTNIPG